MKSGRTKPATVDDYIAAFPAEVRSILKTLRATIRNAAPDAVETIRYDMPTLTLGRDIIHFGAFKAHIGLFPPVRDPDLVARTLAYRGEKGNLRFPLDQPIPYALIAEIVTARVKAIREKPATKQRAKPRA